MTTGARYRVEDGRSCIDIKVRHSGQLFDGRDPAPFRERDLDEDAVDYVMGAGPSSSTSSAGSANMYAAAR